MEKLWKEFQNVLNAYLKYTEEYRDEYIDLRNRDAEDTKSIQDHYDGEQITKKYKIKILKNNFRGFQTNRADKRIKSTIN